jgi:hypothetical protein
MAIDYPPLLFSQFFNVSLNKEYLERSIENKKLEINDFVLNPVISSPINQPPIPLLFDGQNDAFIYSLNIDPLAAINYPFHFIYLRQNTKLVGSINFLDRFSVKSNYTDPYFIFSIGRCGSTLLSKLLSCFDVISISEPDFYNGLVQDYLLNRTELSLLKHQKIMSIMTADILKPFAGSNSFLKLSSNCNLFPELILSVCNSKPKTIFLIRQFEPWLVSRSKSFGTGIEIDLRDYVRGLETLSFIKTNFDCMLIKYEELCQNPHAIALDISNFFSLSSLDTKKFEEIFLQDSQSGMQISRENLSKKDNKYSKETKSVADFWKKNRPIELIQRLSLQDYI